MVTRVEIKQLLDHPAHLFEQVWRFNVEPASYADRSHLKKLGLQEPAIAQLKSTRGGLRLLSKLLLEKTGLINQAALEFSKAPQRLALLDQETLFQLMAYAGSAIYSAQMALVLSREERAQLIEQVGEGPYQFGVQRSAFPGGENHFLEFINSFAPSTAANRPNPVLVTQIFEAGQRCIEICLAGEPHALTERFILKFPSVDEGGAYSPDLRQQIRSPRFHFPIRVGQEDKEKIWQFLYRLLIREISPGLKLCFN